MAVQLDKAKNNLAISLESLPDLRADYLILSSGYGASSSGNSGAARRRYEALREDPLWKTLPAVREGHLLEVDGVVWNAHGLIAKERAIEDLADWLAKRGVPFRTAYKLTGEIVAWCIEHGKTLEDMTLEEYKSFSEVFDESLYEDISIAACVAKRTSKGGASPANIAAQIEYLKQVTA